MILTVESIKSESTNLSKLDVLLSKKSSFSRFVVITSHLLHSFLSIKLILCDMHVERGKSLLLKKINAFVKSYGDGRLGVEGVEIDPSDY